MDVISILQSKNRCLQRLLERSSCFLSDTAQAELDEKWDQRLEILLRERDAIFKALDLYDRKVTEVVSQLTFSEQTPALMMEVEKAMAEKDRLVQQIIEKDQELIGRIELRKSGIAGDLSSSRKNRDLVGKFKSTWVAEAGEELDKTL